MVNQPHVFKHRDIVRAVKAARAAGIDASQVKVDPHTGEITVGPAPGADGTGVRDDVDVEQWLSKHHADQR
jgi:hypothetical protein